MKTSPTTIPNGRGERASEAGFTLVEALTAMVILIFGLMAVTNLFLVAASSNTVANQGTAATTAATQTMEAIKAVPFGILPKVTSGDVDSDLTGAPAPLPEYSRYDSVAGVGQIRTRWMMTAISATTVFIRVRSEGTGALAGARSRAEFTTFRSCTTTGC